MRTALRELRTALAQGDKAAAESKLRVATSVLDKSAQKGIVHKNTASRYKARLADGWRQCPPVAQDFSTLPRRRCGLPFFYLGLRQDVSHICLSRLGRETATLLLIKENNKA